MWGKKSGVGGRQAKSLDGSAGSSGCHVETQHVCVHLYWPPAPKQAGGNRSLEVDAVVVRVVAALEPDALVCEDVTRRLAHDEQRGGHEGGRRAEALTAGGGVRARAVGGFSCSTPPTRTMSARVMKS